ncbi:MAG: hypothetical protein R3358_04965, partial [Woeseiaceae bacterium]|nr:hypothetical protein [Woeseiaceae bacterium]
AYLTMDDIGDFVTDADLSFAPMQALGWSIDMVSWRETGVDWSAYDAVYICTPWDYPEDPAAFMRLLEAIDTSRAVLVNDIELVRWTLEKTYLRDLETKGADIVPSAWFGHFDANDFDRCFEQFATDKIVIKPVVGANAVDTYVVERPLSAALRDELAEKYDARRFVVQPFIDNIRTEGEYSLFYFSGVFSHAIRKLPKAGDFRVQEEHGADILSETAPPAAVEAATRIVGLVDPEPVYVRVDLVRGDDDRFLLMELELIEPSLYLRTDAGAAERFAQAFDAHVRARQ